MGTASHFMTAELFWAMTLSHDLFSENRAMSPFSCLKSDWGAPSQSSWQSADWSLDVRSYKPDLPYKYEQLKL